MPERPKGADCKSAGSRLRRFESFSLHQSPARRGPVNQRGNSSAGRASAFQAECHGFESRFPLQRTTKGNAHIAQSAEHFLGKEEVTSSILVVGSRSGSRSAGGGFADAWAVDEV